MNNDVESLAEAINRCRMVFGERPLLFTEMADAIELFIKKEGIEALILALYSVLMKIRKEGDNVLR